MPKMDLSVSLSAILFALNFSGTECSSILAVVSLACANCIRKPRMCCTGTFILPSFVLTSRTCAETCYAIDFEGREVPFNGTYVHVHHGPRLKGITGVDGAAIARISNVTHNNYNKLSPLEALSAIGFKVLIPIFSNKKMSFTSAIITLCEKGSIYADGYYICTAVNVNDRCKIQQGSPLFFNGKIIGVMGVRSFKTCNYLQTAFVALSPFITWIQTVVNYESFTKVQMTKEEFPITATPSKALTFTNSSVTKFVVVPHVDTETDLNDIKQTSLNEANPDVKTIMYWNPLTSAINSTVISNNDLKAYKTIFPHGRNILRAKVNKTTKQKYSTNKKTLVSKIKPIKRKNTKSRKIARKNLIRSPITSKIKNATTSSIKIMKTTQLTSKTSKLIKTIISGSKLSKSTWISESNLIPAGKTTTMKPTKIIETNEKQASTTDAATFTILESTTINMNTDSSLVTQVTSAMDWFNSNIRSKLINNPPIFVLTTERQSEVKTTEFLDLT